MLTEKLQIFMRIYKQFDTSFSLICYYSFIFGLLRISIGLSVFRFVANEYHRRAIWLLSAICNIRSAIRWVIPKVILNYLRLPILHYHTVRLGFSLLSQYVWATVVAQKPILKNLSTLSILVWYLQVRLEHTRVEHPTWPHC